MVIFMYCDRNIEHQALQCIRSLHSYPELKIVFYTLGYDSEIEFDRLVKIRIELNPEYVRYHFYKAHLSLLTMSLFPNEQYLFTDVDVVFSHRFAPGDLRFDGNCPRGAYGPHEYPFLWSMIDGVRVIHDERPLMRYFGVGERSQRYVWSCFYTFGSECRDFFLELDSICRNRYLQLRPIDYFPYADETAFNVCLWKRGATENLGFAFVNTNRTSVVEVVERGGIRDAEVGEHIDELGADWEYIHDADQVILYHGFKEEKEHSAAVDMVERFRRG